MSQEAESKQSLPLKSENSTLQFNEEVSNEEEYKEIESIQNRSTDIIIALVGAVGTDLNVINKLLSDHLVLYGYKTEIITISRHIIKKITKLEYPEDNHYERIKKFIKDGDEVRRKAENAAILAMGAVAEIKARRGFHGQDRVAYIIDSLKHTHEVRWLRDIYKESFYLIGVYAGLEDREKYLKSRFSTAYENPKDEKNKIEIQNHINEIIKLDEDEPDDYGQHTTDVFQLSDFFICYKTTINQGKHERVDIEIDRFFRLIFKDPHVFPTFDEYAMFLAFATAARSADLSRQVGAVIAAHNTIRSVGANDNPYIRGGNYPKDEKGQEEKDENKDKKRIEWAKLDCTLGYDTNRDSLNEIKQKIIEAFKEKCKNKNIINTLSEVLKKSPINDITEYGRSVHAEMEAILSCSRNQISSMGTTLYCTTFPCHYCTKHIIGAGIFKVIYVEPYPKSKAKDLFQSQIRFVYPGDPIYGPLGKIDDDKNPKFVRFEPFVGVGPRRYIDLFSLTLGFGTIKKRKDNNTGKVTTWEKHNNDTKLRLALSNITYKEEERNSNILYFDKLVNIFHHDPMQSNNN